MSPKAMTRCDGRRRKPLTGGTDPPICVSRPKIETRRAGLLLCVLPGLPGGRSPARWELGLPLCTAVARPPANPTGSVADSNPTVFWSATGFASIRCWLYPDSAGGGVVRITHTTFTGTPLHAISAGWYPCRSNSMRLPSPRMVRRHRRAFQMQGQATMSLSPGTGSRF